MAMGLPLTAHGPSSQFPAQKEEPTQGSARSKRERGSRTQVLPGVAARQRADRAPDAIGEAAVDRLAPRLVSTAKEPVHDADRRGVKRAECRGVQALREKQDDEVVGAPADHEKARYREREADDENGAQRERGIEPGDRK